MPFLERERGSRIWYDTGGAGGSPVLLIMGMGAGGIGWLAQILELQQTHRVAWYDHLGIGRSGKGRQGCTIRSMSDDALALADHLGWDETHIVGISMGGMIAQRFALDHPARTRSLTLIATHAGGPSTIPPTPRALWLMHTSQMFRGAARWARIRSLLFPRHFLADPANAPLLEMASSLLPMELKLATFTCQLAAVIGHNTRRRLSELEGIHTLIVRPGKDILIPPRESDRLQRAIPGADLARFDNAGHGVIAQSFDLLNPLMLEHFQRADN